MFTLPFGFLIVAGVLWYSFHGSNPDIFVNEHSFVIVGVGTVASLVLIAPWKGLKNLAKSIIYLFRNEPKREFVVLELHKLAENKGAQIGFKHDLVDYAKGLWEQGVDKSLAENLIYTKFDELNSQLDEPVSIFNSLAKYPPALGMMGTAMGMVQLFAGLSAENKGNIGADLALAMTATFYGLILANLVISPMSDRLNNQKIRHQELLDIICKNLVLINSDEPVSIIKDANITLIQEKIA
ncbi:MAG: MotA/TolQ/ExbB proton channel family protein [Bacteriovoracaceae bacterium]|nr:MotA/TolQ/ExbB proton channel family protein [Bacteriovoracaceae bacterium]